LTSYLLDTNIVSDLMRNPRGVAAARVDAIDDESICTSIVVAAELRFGVALSSSVRLKTRLETVLAPMKIMPLDSPVDRHYADIRLDLTRRGELIGPNDLLIAAHALALGCTLVTDNEREFSRVKSLAIENWLR
jgi:tRNA(fMet)-specific endonuclease VapC